MLAKRGRAAYTGERSIGSVDAGAMGVAVMFEGVSAGSGQRLTGSSTGPPRRRSAMKKFVNDPQQFVPEMLKGIALANPDTLQATCPSTT